MEISTRNQDALAKHLAETRPSAGLFDHVRAGELSDAGLIDALVASEKLLRYAEGLQMRVLGVLAAHQARENSLTAGVIEAEVAAAVLWSPAVVQHRLGLAKMLSARFPETLNLLCAGQVAWRQAVAVVETTAALDDESARAVQDRVLSRMPRQSAATTRRALHRAVLAADPHGARKRHAAQAARRRVELRAESDGMATVELYTTAQTGAAVMAAVAARAKKSLPGDPRTADQRRADTLADLVLTGAGVRFSRTQHSDTTPPDAVLAALVHVTVGIDTLLGKGEEPAELRGYGPITAGQARALAFAPGSVWRRLLTAPDGTLLHTDPTAYRPTASVDRLVRARDRHCTFPGCSMPAARCDLDHIDAFNHKNPDTGGLTVPENLHALCRRHHRLKTAGRFTPVRDHDGTTTWTSATGHRYATPMPSYAAA